MQGSTGPGARYRSRGSASLGSRMIKGADSSCRCRRSTSRRGGGGSIAANEPPRFAGRAAQRRRLPARSLRPRRRATDVTDANLLLGYLNPESPVGGDLKLNYGKAELALAELGDRLHLSAIRPRMEYT